MSAPRVQVVLLWHLHQPPGRDPLDGSRVRPWAWRHALAHHLGLVERLAETPDVHVTFSLSPALLDEIEDCAAGLGDDALRRLAQRPAEALDGHERAAVVAALVEEHPPHVVARFPRYRELLGLRAAGARFALHDLRDAQVLSTLMWCDRDRRERDPVLRALVEKGRGYDTHDQRRLAECESALLAEIVPAWRHAAESGQIELCATPYGQPILPLLCDTHVHHEAHPGAPLPRRYRHPEDACDQLRRAVARQRERFGSVPAGVWPPEAALSDEALTEIARAGLRWTAADEGLLERSLRQALVRDAGGLVHPLEMLYRPWLRRTAEGDVTLVFRDRLLSDLIGFTYARREPRQAAGDLLARLRRVGQAWREHGLDGEPVVGVMLDGDNPWPHYPDGGRDFLRALYGGLARDSALHAVTVSEALSDATAFELPRLAAGSWRPGELSTWIGQADQNRAWGVLGEARDALEASRGHVPPPAFGRAQAALHAASAGDWFRAYGEQPATPWHFESDRLFRRQLAAVYHALALPAPEALHGTLISTRRCEHGASPPTRALAPRPDGGAASVEAWAGAGVYRVPAAGDGAAPRATRVTALRYGLGGGRLHVRVETATPAGDLLASFDVAVAFARRAGPRYRVRRAGERAQVVREERTLHGWLRLPTRAEIVVGDALEFSLPLRELGPSGDGTLAFRVALLRLDAELESHPDGAPLTLDLGEAGAPATDAENGQPQRSQR